MASLSWAAWEVEKSGVGGTCDEGSMDWMMLCGLFVLRSGNSAA